MGDLVIVKGMDFMGIPWLPFIHHEEHNICRFYFQNVYETFVLNHLFLAVPQGLISRDTQPPPALNNKIKKMLIAIVTVTLSTCLYFYMKTIISINQNLRTQKR